MTNRTSKPGAGRPYNPIRNQREIRTPTPLLRKAAVANAARPPKRTCPNKECATPKVEDGVCHNCGTVVDDSNIVSEVSFGEDSRGAAVVQGSYVAEGQGSSRSMGPGLRRAAGAGEDRESTIRDGKGWISGFATQLNVSEQAIQHAGQIFKLAANTNFIQGRRLDMVAAVCLYSAARKVKSCNVMLIDFADRLQVNVFKLGHTFKALHRAVTMSAKDIFPIVPEDLIYRFAMKLEFGELTATVAKDAVRLVQRMSIDWMVMGRRPSGVCGACLILAARMHNFRRTVTEVVYIVKVTTATIQKRMEEFKLTPSSGLTVHEFLNNEFMLAAHDPPSFYEKQEAFIKTKKTRKRKRRGQAVDEEDEENQDGEETDPNKRQKTAFSNSDQALPTLELRRDADGFAIPAQPHPPQSEFDDIVDDTMVDGTAAALDKLVSQFGPEALNHPSDDEEDVSSTTTAQKRDGRRGRNEEVFVPESWSKDEEQLMHEISEIISDSKMSEMISDPNNQYHTDLYNLAEKRTMAHMTNFQNTNPSKEICMDEEISVYEFANDPEVQNCLLSPEDIAKKEKVWVNENKSWLRKQQIKAYQKRMAANGPPKRTRNRKKVPKIGELQTSPASTAGESAVNAMKSRNLSKKINYKNISSLFEDMDAPGGSVATSRVTSRAGSSAPDSPSESSSESDDENTEVRDATTRAEDEIVSDTRHPGNSASVPGRSPSLPPNVDLSDDEGDYVEPEPEAAWRAGINNRGVEEAEDEEGFDEEDYDDEGEDIGDDAHDGVWDD